MPCAARHNRAFLLIALFCGLAAAERPLLPQHPLGTGSAAFVGAGAGNVSGVNAVFVNPGALFISAGSEYEVGMMGLSQGLSPYSLLGGRSGTWSYAAGYFRDERFGLYHHGVTAGAARELAPGAAFGAAVRSQGGYEGFGVDADAGMLLRPRGWASLGDWAVLGLAVRNLAESGVGQEPDGYRTLRSYAISAGARRDAARLLLVPMRDPDAAYEFRADGLRAGGLSHTFSAGASFTPAGTLSLRASMRLPHEGTALIGFGGSIRFDVGAGGLRCGYAFSTSGVAGAAEAPAHSLSVNLALGTRADHQPPWVEVRADRAFLGTEAPGHDRVHFRLRAADRSTTAYGSGSGDDFSPPGLDALDEAKAPGDAYAGGRGELREWVLAIFATDGQGRKIRTVRSFRGKDLPPRLIRWDGRDDAGSALAAGFYAFRLSARDKAGNLSETAWQLVELGTVPKAADSAGGRPAARGGDGPGNAEPDSGIDIPPIIEGDDG